MSSRSLRSRLYSLFSQHLPAAAGALLGLAGALLPADASAGIFKQLHVEWTYNTALPGLVGYRLYKEGTLVGEVSDPTLLAMDWELDLETGTNTFTMTAVDATGQESGPSPPYVIEVPAPDATGNIPPVPKITASALQGAAPFTVTFQSAGSTDYDGNIIDFSWAFGNGERDFGETASHTFDLPGTYEVSLAVTDDRGATAEAWTTITVTEPPNAAPTAALSATATMYPFHVEWTYNNSMPNLAGFRVYENGVQICETTDITARKLDCTAPLESGRVKLTVTAYDTADKELIIADNTTINATGLVPAMVKGEAPIAVSFNGLASQDSDGAIAGHAWDFGDGEKVNAPAAIHQYIAPGVYPVTLTVTDNRGMTAKAATSITVLAANRPPVATGGSLTMAEDLALSGTLGASDPDTDPLVFSIVGKPANGTITLTNAGTGAFSYTPSSNFSGLDSFTYTVSDGKAESAIATVSLTITPVNDPPKAVNDAVFTKINTSKTISVLANDSDAEGALSLFKVSAPTNGTAYRSGSNVLYQPKSNFVGKDTFTYTVMDNGGLTATATVTVTVSR